MLCQFSSVVEQQFCKLPVVGSSPTTGSIKCPVRLEVRTPGFHPGNSGSIPLRDAIYMPL